MRPLGPAHGRPPQSPRPAVVFASFRLRLGSGTTPRLSEEKGAQRDDEVPDVKKSGGVETWSPSFRLITKGDAPGLSPESSAFLSVGWNWGSFGCEPRLLHEDRNRSCSFQRTVRYLPGVSSTVGIPRCSLSLDSWVSDGTCTSLSGRAPVTPLVH
nr:heterogeneous nuclear ribonucleoprotein F isoform X2 [Globicephala melas]